MQHIVGQLVFGGDPDLEVQPISPWLDFRLPPMPKSAKLAMVEAQTHRRIVKTHLPIDALVFSPKARYVYVGRDGRDAGWSMHNHMLNMTQQAFDLLNNFPGIDAPISERPPADIHEFWRMWWEQNKSDPDGFLEHIHGWWLARDQPNVLLLHYANLKRDLPGEMRRIANFLEIPIDEARWDAMVEHCTFDWMKANAAKVAPAGGMLWEGGGTTFIHRGVNGRWTDTLTAEEVADYEAQALKVLGPEGARWLATGERP